MNVTKKLAKRLLVINDIETGRRIREQRKRLGMSQQDLAKAANISQAEVSNVERGTKRPVRVLHFSQALKVRPAFLLGGR